MTSWLDTFGSAAPALAMAAVFLITFAIVGGLGYLFLLRGRTPALPSSEPAEPLRTTPESGWTAEWSGELPAISGRVEERSGQAWPPGHIDRRIVPPDPLVVVRGAAVKAYRWFMAVIGVIGIGGGLALILSHTGANMMALPGGIVLLLGLGALLNALVPSRRVTDSFASVDLSPLLRKVNVQIQHAAPLHIQLTEAQTRRAVDLIKQGLPISESARTVYPGFDRLDASARHALESALQQLVKGQ